MSKRRSGNAQADTKSLKRQLEAKGEALREELEMAEKRAYALEGRQAGKSYAQIGREMGVNPATARKYVLDELIDDRENKGEDLEAVRDLEVQRLDKIMEVYWPKMIAGDKFATSLLLQIMERRSAYLGLDAPKRTEFIGAMSTLTPEEARNMTDEDLRKRAIELTQKVLGMTPTEGP